MFNKSEKIESLAKALALAQSEITPAIKDSTNPHFRSNYATLTSVWDACSPLSKHGLSVVQTTNANTDGIELVTTLLHESGEWISSILFLPVVQKTPQGYGSALTYARRYALSAMVGVSPDDDDGKEASKHESDSALKAKTVQNKILPQDEDPVGMYECTLCGESLVLSTSKTSYYCPNWKNKEKGEHSKVKA